MFTRKKAIRECKRQFNHVGIYGGFLLCRLIGFAEGFDFYYHLRDADGKEGYYSMVGGFYSIKRMGKKGYLYTERNFAFHSPKADKFKITQLEESD